VNAPPSSLGPYAMAASALTLNRSAPMWQGSTTHRPALISVSHHLWSTFALPKVGHMEQRLHGRPLRDLPGDQYNDLIAARHERILFLC